VIAMQIERKAEDCYKAEYARRHIGERYEGTISGVTQRGVFIELPNGVEGFVPAASLTATGTVLTEGVRLADPVSGKSWSLGDSLMVVIVRADVNLGKIDFEVA
jgi:ribonuclease R